MKVILLFIYFNIFAIGASANFLRFLQSSENKYSYTDYKATSSNQNLSNQELTCSNIDESVVYITNTGIEISDSTITKSSGDSSNTENSEFYGVNAAVLVQGGEVTIKGGAINTKAKGANALCATNKGTVTIEGTTITSTGESSARGLHATYGGKITAKKVTISSKGGSCASLATDRGEGTVTCESCTLSTQGAGSPLIYSTGQITVSGTTGTATGAQAVVVEGKNTATVEGSSNLKCNGIGNRNNVDKCGVMLYQSMSGDADSGTSTFNCKSSTIEILSGSSVYSSAPMFFITNTDASINLEGCTLTYGSNIFLSAAGTSEWGTSGSNGGVVSLTLKNQEIVGDFSIDSNSGLTIKMENSSIKGKINNAKTAAKIEITLDSSSSIELTGDSYYTSLTNSDSDGTNINKGSYAWEQVDATEISRPSGGQGMPGGESGQGGSGGESGQGGPGGPGGESGQGGPGGPGGESGQGGPGGPGGESGQGGPGGPGGESGQGGPGGESGQEGPGDLNFGPRTSSVNETNSNSRFLDFSSLLLLLLFILF